LKLENVLAQFNAFAKLIAVNFFPIPDSPAKRYEDGILPL
jgi:hypothetical protein